MIIISLSILMPIYVSAQIIFTEVMYDTLGIDSKHEWFEVFNSGSEQVDITTYDLIENDKGHGITSFQGESILSSKQYAIISSDAGTFLADNPEFSGLIFDSVFSLNNTGEKLELKDSSGNITDSITYNPEIGAKGNGNTLQKNGDIWIAAEATPGIENKTESANEDEKTTGSTTTQNTETESISSHSQQTELSDEKEKQILSIGAGRERLGSPHNSMLFEVNIKDENVFNSKEFIWSFGDGDSKRGKKVNHTYLFSGTYSVVVQGFAGNLKAIARTIVHIKDPEVSFIYHGNSVEIKNNGKTEFNLGKIRLESGNNIFDIAKDTIILAGANIHIPVSFYEKPDQSCKYIVIKYPDGEILAYVLHKDIQFKALKTKAERIIKILQSPCKIDDKIDLLEISENSDNLIY